MIRDQILQAETDTEVRKHEEAAKKAVYYEAEVAKKEREAREEAEARRQKLAAHMDRANAELLQEHKMKRVKSPPVRVPPPNYDRKYSKTTTFSGGKMKIRGSKTGRGRRSMQTSWPSRWRTGDSGWWTSTRGARPSTRPATVGQPRSQSPGPIQHFRGFRFAAYREIEESRKMHDQDAWRRQLELQVNARRWETKIYFRMEMQKKAPPVDDGWLWWAERPDEHGWRAARIEQQSNQVERNEYMK